MPLTRYQLRNEFSLADPDLYGSADKDDAEALLEGVAMAGLVGVLRQLGDLAEFAAEIFHDLHEEVMATAARGHTLMVRVQQLEAEVPAIEKEFLSRTNHSSFYTNAGVDWHPNLHMEQNLVTHGDLPRCVMDSYEECWGPPRLFLLDKFDVAGAGACLKRYTDPSFFKNEMDTFENSHLEVQRDRKFRKVKKKGSRWKNADTESLPISHVKLHQLFLEESIENAFSDPARLVKLKKRQFNGSPLAPKSGKSYMEKFLKTPSPDNVAAIYDTTINLPLLKMTSDNSSESGLDIVEIRAVSPVTTLTEMKESTSISADEQEMVTNACMENLNREASIQAAVKIPELAAAEDRNGTLHGPSRVKPERIVDGGKENRGDLDGDHGDDVTSEAENFMDALATIESEIETDNECQPRNNCRFLTDRRYGADSDLNEEQFESRTRSSDSQSFGISYISDYGDSSSRKSKSSFSTKKSQSSFSSKKSHSSFSSSDTISNVTENVASDDEVAADSYACLENRATDEVYASCVQLPTHVETQGSNSNKIHEDQLFDNGEVSSTSRVTDTNFTFVEMKPGASTVAELLVEHKLNREPSNDIKLSSDVFDTNKNGLNITDSSEVAADLYEKLVFCGKLQLNESDIGAKSVTSDALVHKMRTMEPDLHSENDDNCLVEVKRIDLAEEDCVANSGNLVTGSQELLVTAAKDLLPCSPLPEAEACLDKTVLPNKLDDIMPAEPVLEAVALMEASIESEIVAELVDTPVGHVTDEQQLDAFVDVSQEEVGCSKLDEKLDLAEVSRVVDDEETGKSSIKVDDMEESSAAFDATAKCQEDSGDNNHASFEDPSTETVRPDDTAVSATVAVGSAISGSHSLNSIHSVLRDPMVSGKCLSAADKTHQPAMEIAEQTSPSVIESGGQWYEVGAPAIESDSTEIITGSIDFFNLKGNVPNSAPGEQIDRSTLDEVAYVPSSDQHGELRVLPSVHPWESSEDVTSSLSSQLLKPGTCLEQSLYVPTGQLNDGRFPRDEASTVSPKVLALSSDLEIDSDKLELDPSTSLHSAYALLDDPSIARAEEVPPLPPLPPMQWRIGKAQQHSLASQNGLAEHDEGLFSMPFQRTTEPKAQYELSVSEAGSLLPSHLYLSAASKEEKLNHDSGEIVGDFVHPALGISDCLDNGNEEFCGSSSEKAESSNPIFTEPGLPNERHEYSYPVIKSGVESCKPALPLPIDEDTTPGHEISSLLEHPTQTSLDMVMHTLEGGSVQHGSQEQEELVENYLDTSIIPPLTYQESPPTRVKEQPPNSVEEQPPNRVEVQAQNRVEKQPPNQFEEVTSFKIEEMPPNKIEECPSGDVSEHPQNNENMQLPCEFEEQTSKNVQNQAPRDINEQPCAQVEVQHPPEAEKQSQHGMLTSGGEIAPVFNAFALPGLSTSETFFPPHSLALLPISEAGKADGHPTVKLPRPRNPLIDAVAAVDKSKLRKVSDRVQPPIGRKANERGSLLEQIRAKSFNLKPAVGTRPSIQNIQGPRTNLQLAAILEKANAIRQATTGSDEDEDSWSDS